MGLEAFQEEALVQEREAWAPCGVAWGGVVFVPIGKEGGRGGRKGVPGERGRGARVLGLAEGGDSGARV